MKLIEKVEQHLPWVGAYMRDEYSATPEERRLLLFFTRTIIEREHARQDRIVGIGLVVAATVSYAVFIWGIVKMVS